MDDFGLFFELMNFTLTGFIIGSIITFFIDLKQKVKILDFFIVGPISFFLMALGNYMLFNDFKLYLRIFL